MSSWNGKTQLVRGSWTLRIWSQMSFGFTIVVCVCVHTHRMCCRISFSNCFFVKFFLCMRAHTQDVEPDFLRRAVSHVAATMPNIAEIAMLNYLLVRALSVSLPLCLSASLSLCLCLSVSLSLCVSAPLSLSRTCARSLSGALARARARAFSLSLEEWPIAIFLCISL